MKFTFGKTIAAQRLEELLENNPIARRKISALLSNYTSDLLTITLVKHPRPARLCMELLRDYTLRRIDVKKNLTEDIRSYAKNVVVCRYRAYCYGFNEVVKAIATAKAVRQTALANAKVALEEYEKNKRLTSGEGGV